MRVQIEYGFPWRFDLELTRTVGQVKPPPGSGFGVEVSVVVHPGPLQASIGRDEALALSEAEEVCAEAIEVGWSAWSTGVCPAPIETGESAMRFGLRAGFRDPLPDFATVLWRNEPVLGIGAYFVRAGEWVRIRGQLRRVFATSVHSGEP